MGNHIRLLLVEDDSSIVLFLKDFLQKEGFEADSADGQQEALYCLEGRKYDAVLDPQCPCHIRGRTHQTVRTAVLSGCYQKTDTENRII